MVLPTPGPQTPPLAGLQGAGADQFARPTPRRPPPRLSPPLGGGDRAPACGPDVFFCGPKSEPGPGRAGAHFRPGLRSTLKPPCLAHMKSTWTMGAPTQPERGGGALTMRTVPRGGSGGRY